MNAPADLAAFADLDAFVALPRTAELALSPDGRRLVTTLTVLRKDGTKRVTSLWEVDPAGVRPARRLTRSRAGEAHPVFAADGSLLFTSTRPDPDGDEDEDDDDDRPAVLWQLPEGGEARVLGERPGALAAVATARDAPVVVVLADTLPGSRDGVDDATRRTARRNRTVKAVLHSGYPVRWWDADLGPGEPRLLAGGLTDGSLAWRDLTPVPGRALDRAGPVLAPDGATAVVAWRVAEPRGSWRSALVAVDTATGARRTLHDDGTGESGDPAVSPDGRWVAFVQEDRSTPHEPVDTRLMVVPLDGSAPARGVADGWDRWPGQPRWTADGTAVLVTADEAGGRPVFRVDVTTGAVTRLTGDRGHYTELQVSRDGRHVYALRDAVDAAPAPVRLEPGAPDQQPVALPGPAAPLPLPGRLTEVTTSAADGTPLRGPGWPCPRVPDRTRSCCGCTVARSARGTAGPGAGRRGGSSRRATPSCCRTPRFPPATAGRWSSAAGGSGEGRRTTTSWRSPTPRCSGRTSTRPGRRRWAAPTAATSSTGSPGTPTGSARSSLTRACGT